MLRNWQHLWLENVPSDVAAMTHPTWASMLEFFHKISWWVKFVNYFCEKAPSYMLNCVLNTPQNCTLNLKNTPGKIHQCMCGDFFSKFKVFMSVSIFLYFHFVKYKSNKSISAVKSWCCFYYIVKNFFLKTSLWLYEFFF